MRLLHNSAKKRPKGEWVEKHPVHVPESSKEALRQAMELEHIPAAQFEDLLWLMTQESGGRVNVKNRYVTPLHGAYSNFCKPTIS